MWWAPADDVGQFVREAGHGPPQGGRARRRSRTAREEIKPPLGDAVLYDTRDAAHFAGEFLVVEGYKPRSRMRQISLSATSGVRRLWLVVGSSPVAGDDGADRGGGRRRTAITLPMPEFIAGGRPCVPLGDVRDRSCEGVVTRRL